MCFSFLGTFFLFTEEKKGAKKKHPYGTNATLMTPSRFSSNSS